MDKHNKPQPARLVFAPAEAKPPTVDELFEAWLRNPGAGTQPANTISL